jgi:aminopeptidase N
MKRQPLLLIGFLLLLLFLIVILSPLDLLKFLPLPSARHPVATSLFDTFAWNDRTIFRGGLSQAGQPFLDGLLGASVYHLDLTLVDDPTHVSGTEQVHYTNRTGVSLDRIEMRLFANLLGGKSEISAVKVDGKTVAPVFSHLNSVMAIPLASSLSPGGSIVLEVEFSVTVPTTLDVSYGILAYTSGVLALAHCYPMIAVYDQNGWNEEVPAPWGDILYNDASFYLVRVDAPARLTLVASGREVQRQERVGRQQVTYAAGPARDFYLAASADYTKVSKTIGGLTVNSYAPSGDEAQSRLALDTAVAAIQDYSQRYTPYPYAQFNLAAIPTQALGIEYPGEVAILQDLYTPRSADDDQARIYLESTVAHEVGHQWFYNLVGDNQLDEPWLDEALAQFATWQYYGDRYGATAAQSFETEALKSRWDRLQDADIPVGKRVQDYTDSEYGAIVYGRGPLFFITLENQIGESTFSTFIRDYVQTYSWQNATTDGLKKVAEKDCACDLTPLFQQWVYPK